ncbi:proline-rich receptor-like protein kinase PERK2 [Papaver somniferum]|uniref:proline-rich receptor-like protein kinase PERK2 n=1 Tax=Papaver somniferum TaxID=3469 RepID=UPI000E7039A6|nr:proline-rich receptor-like protein kinase PERK2 [Papaver somniferum]
MSSMGGKGGLFTASALLVVLVSLSFLFAVDASEVQPPKNKPIYMPPTPTKHPIYVPSTPPKKSLPSLPKKPIHYVHSRPPKKPVKLVKLKSPPTPYQQDHLPSTVITAALRHRHRLHSPPSPIANPTPHPAKPPPTTPTPIPPTPNKGSPPPPTSSKGSPPPPPCLQDHQPDHLPSTVIKLP